MHCEANLSHGNLTYKKNDHISLEIMADSNSNREKESMGIIIM